MAGVIGSDVSTCWWHWLGQHQRVVPRRTQLTDQFPESLKPLKCLSMFVVCAPQDSMFDQFREKSFVPQYGDEDWWGDYLVAWPLSCSEIFACHVLAACGDMRYVMCSFERLIRKPAESIGILRPRSLTTVPSTRLSAWSLFGKVDSVSTATNYLFSPKLTS